MNQNQIFRILFFCLVDSLENKVQIGVIRKTNIIIRYIYEMIYQLTREFSLSELL